MLDMGKVVSGKVEIHDLDGRTIYSGTIQDRSNMMINLEYLNMSAGTYILSVMNSEGVNNERFVIQ